MALSEEAKTLICELAGRGAVYSSIAEDVTSALGITPTRGQVAGVLHRAGRHRGARAPREKQRSTTGVRVKSSSATAKKSPVAPAAARPLVAPSPAAPAPLPEPLPRFLLEAPEPPMPASSLEAGPCTLDRLRAGRCHWPLWGHGEKPMPRSALYCGDKTFDPAKPYCAHHRELARSKPQIEADDGEGDERRGAAQAAAGA